jgi:hypothetical protein
MIWCAGNESGETCSPLVSASSFILDKHFTESTYNQYMQKYYYMEYIVPLNQPKSYFMRALPSLANPVYEICSYI